MHLHGWLSLALGCPAGRLCHQFCGRPQIVLLRLQGPLRGHPMSFCWVGRPAALPASACLTWPLVFLSLAVCTHVLVDLFKHNSGEHCL